MQPYSRRAPVLFAAETDSTNLALRRLAAEGAVDGTVFWSARQSAGRGRLGRSFASPEGGLYYSMLLTASDKPERDLLLTPAAGLAVCRALERVCGVRCGLKWPNDLLFDGRKAVGILTEMTGEMGKIYYIVVGIGINVNISREDFPEEIRDIAAALCEMTGDELSRVQILRAVLEEFM